MSVITPPVTYIYAVFFIIGGIIATIANIMVLIILWFPEHRSRSNKILTSLAASDFLVGLLVFPMTAYQVLHYASLSSCDIDFARVYCSAALQGSSCLTLGVIAYDRYILLTKINIYHKLRTKRLVIILVVLAWVIPGLNPLLRWVNKFAYLTMITAIFIIPFVTLCLSYFLITSAVRKQELLLKKRYLDSIKPIPATTGSNGNTPSTDGNMNKNYYKTQKRHIKLAKQVTLLILAYIVCVTPITLWIIMNLVNIAHPYVDNHAFQNFYLFTMLAIAWNSCLNPVIYYAKNPEIRKGFRRVIGIKIYNTESNTTSVV